MILCVNWQIFKVVDTSVDWVNFMSKGKVVMPGQAKLARPCARLPINDNNGLGVSNPIVQVDQKISPHI